MTLIHLIFNSPHCWTYNKGRKCPEGYWPCVSNWERPNFPFLWVIIWPFLFCYMVLLPVLCNDKWWMPSYVYFSFALLKRPLEKKLINNQMSPFSTKLVIGFRWSWAVIGGNLWSNQVSVWWGRKRNTLSLPLSYLSPHIHCCRFQYLSFPPTGYQLRTCQPPPPVANATILTDDDEFEIGLSYFILLVYWQGTMRNKINLHQT